MKWLLLLGAAVVGLVLWARRNAATTTPDAWRGVPPAPGYQTDKRVTAPSASAGVRTTFDTINSGGCTLAARKIGGGGMAQAGCDAFLKYATPIGWGEMAWDGLTSSSLWSDTPALAAEREREKSLGMTPGGKPAGFR